MNNPIKNEQTSRYLRRLPITLALSVALVVFVAPRNAGAQDAPTVTRLLSSRELRERAAGVEGFLALSPSEQGGQAGDLIVSLLNTEGEGVMDPRVGSDPAGEAHGGYQIALVRAGLLLNDQRALPGMVYLGLQIDADAETFVVGAGPASVPLLARAWTKSGPLRVPVLGSAAALLAAPQQLGSTDQATLWHILTTANGFEWSLVSELSKYPEFLSVVAWTADSGITDIERGQARSARTDLMATIANLSPSDLWKREMSLLAGVCSGTHAAHCESLVNVGSTVQRHLAANRWLPARNTISTFTTQLGQSCDGGEFSPAECRALTGNANQTLSKLPS